MKIFIVTSGEYSDYGINAVFSSKEKAEAYFMGLPESSRGYSVEEWDVDTESPLISGTRWIVELRIDGSIAKELSYEVTHSGQDRGDGYTFAAYLNPQFPAKHTVGWFAGRSYVSHEHALKLAVEQRQLALREHPEAFQ